MKNRYFYVIAYSLILISFLLLQKKFIPRPNLRKLELNNKVKKFILRKNNFDIYMNIELKRNLSIGDTYIITDSTDNIFQITPISKWSLKYFDLQTLSNNLPSLIIQNSDLIEVNNNNNYAVGRIKNEYFSQACLVNASSYFFVNSSLNVPEYWDIKYWLETIKNSLKSNLFFYKPNSESCLLITSSNLENFQEDITIINELINFK